MGTNIQPNSVENDEIYAREPICIKDSIPIYSEFNEYIENYERISSDHLESLKKDGTNPFIPEDTWVEMEFSTIQLIKKYSKPNDQILDVGVGVGRVLSEFPKLRRYGLDISLGYLKESHSKGINVCYSLIEDIPYKKEIFDVVLCTDVLEHVLDLNYCCKNILSVLKPDGILIIRVPYREDLYNYVTADYPYRFVHLRNFDEHSLFLLFDRILNCKVQKFSMSTCIQPHPLVVHFKLSKIIKLLLYLIKKINSKYYERLKNVFLKPLEINVVVTKKV